MRKGNPMLKGGKTPQKKENRKGMGRRNECHP